MWCVCTLNFFWARNSAFWKSEYEKTFHFSFCESLKHENETPFPLYFVLDIIHDLKWQWQNHFEDRDVYSRNFIREEMPPELQMELIDFHCNVGLQGKFRERHVINFFERLPEDRCAQIRSFACVYVSVFSTSKICEMTSSRMKLVKPNYGSSLSNEYSKLLLMLGSAKFKFNFDLV